MMLVARLFVSFFKIGIMGFGGGYTIISLASHELLKNNWVDVGTFSDIIAISQMTPGPIAINLATFTGYRVAGILGAVVATLGVVSPSVLLIMIFAELISRAEKHPIKEHVFYFLRPVVLGLILYAVFLLVKGAFLSTGAELSVEIGGNAFYVPAVIVFFISFFLIRKLRLSPPFVMGIAAFFGVVMHFIGNALF
ncbi:chromate transporter [Spirochaetia bacterium 38H-sp]|uniref:Chromate transporter n=1 Tax=Rarispira pelagica TaxID=3141764 RepID=A0ABU9UDM8_9SPIR